MKQDAALASLQDRHGVEEELLSEKREGEDRRALESATTPVPDLATQNIRRREDAARRERQRREVENKIAAGTREVKRIEEKRIEEDLLEKHAGAEGGQ